MTETVELRCDECNNTYLFDHEPDCRDLLGSHYCQECFDKLMNRFRIERFKYK